MKLDPNYIPTFKSNRSNYGKEESGAKPNTLRRVSPTDPRFIALRAGCKKIRILKTNLKDHFEREITDYTEYSGWSITSWRHPYDDNKR